MIKDLAEYGEHRFASYCSDGGATVHRVGDDKNGWDYLVEFPEEPHGGPVDTAPADLSAYVQVKTTRGRACETQIKVSNMLRAARSPQPWFVVLFHLPSGAERPTVYARHFWKDLIAVGLEASQRSQRDRRPLHKRRVTVRFSDSDRQTGDIVAWMLECIRVHNSYYAVRKAEIYRTVGFEKGSGRGTFAIEAPSVDHMLEGFLGLGTGFKLKEYEFTRERFGILDPVPELSGTEGILKIEPLHQRPCSVVVRRSDGNEVPIRLSGTTYAAAFPGPERLETLLRFSAPPLEVIWKHGEKARLKAGLESDTGYPLRIINAMCKITQWSLDGPVEISVEAEGAPTVKGVVVLDTPPAPRSSYQTAEVIARALEVARIAAGVENFEISLQAIHDYRNELAEFAFVHLAEVVTITSEAEIYKPDDVTSVVYCTKAPTGASTLIMAVRRAIQHDMLIGGERHFTCGPAEILEALVCVAASAPDQLSSLHDSNLRALDKRENPVGFGDVHRLEVVREAAPNATR